MQEAAEAAEGAEIIAPPRRGDAEMELNQITEAVIGACIEIHRALGPGLFGSAYEECLDFELRQAGLAFRRQVPLPVVYKGVQLDCGYKMDFLIESAVVIELKAVEKLLPIHEAQLLTYLKMSGCSVGLLINFHAPTLKDGIRRLVNKFRA